MTLAPGTKLGHYEILETIGVGGMGEVYRARDPRIGRDVAIKVSSEEFPGRFAREIRAVAALNHPNICTLYDVGPNYLVMEFVEGPTLSDLIRQGPIPLEESFGIVRQIADALESAHEKGIVHRDLKPGNIKIRPDGAVKVLDFGIAKVEVEAPTAIGTETSPTLSVARTAGGVILGTAAYMAPEQAKGKAVDKRADIWAFGVVLYEMLTGAQLFQGETISDTLAAVLTKEPDWERVPGKVRPVLRRCLERDPKRRLRDIGDVDALLQSTAESVPVKRQWPAWTIAALFVIAFVAMSLLYLAERKTSSHAEPVVLQIAPSATPAPEGSFALSPDGRLLAFAARGSDGIERLWVRPLDSLEAKPLLGTEADYLPPLFWSPDSRWIAFNTEGKLKKIDVSGGPPQTICDLRGFTVGGSWNREGMIILGHPDGGLMRISAEGKNTSYLTRPNQERKESKHMFPVFLPDGKHFLYYSTSGIAENNGVYIGSLDLRPDEQTSKQVLATNFGAVFIPSRDSAPGQLLFMGERTLMVQPFNETLLELEGEPAPLAEKVGSFMAFGFFSASMNGVLVYRSGSAGQISRVTWFDRQGRLLEEAGESGEYWGLALSPDAARAVVSWWNPAQVPMSVNLWFLDFAHGTKMRFTFGEGNSQGPVWSSDGKRIVFSSNRGTGTYNLYQMQADGLDAEAVLESNREKEANSLSRDGNLLLFATRDLKTRSDLWLLPLEGERKPVPFLCTEFNEFDGRFSPDMQWVAYTSDETGNNEIYVRRFHQNSAGSSSGEGEKWMVSKGRGMAPRWRKDGRELFYRASDGQIMTVQINPGPVFRAETAKPLFRTPVSAPKVSGTYTYFYWDATAKGDRFLIPTPLPESSSSPFTVLLNWTSSPKAADRR